MLQNEALDVLVDELDSLGDEEGLVSSQKASQATEIHSFTHLTLSKGKMLVAMQWLPHQQVGSCTWACLHSEAASTPQM